MEQNLYLTKRIIAVSAFIILMWGCSGSVDTTKMTADEHYQYAMKLYNDEDYLEALNEFQSIILQFPGSAINDDAKYYLGMTYYKRDQYLLAAYEFSKLIKEVAASPYVPDAQFMLADSYYQLSPPYPLDQSYTKKAIEEFQAFIDFFPINEKVAEAEKKIAELNAKLAEKEYNSALIYERMDYYKAAIEYYEYVAETYHDTEYAPKALYNKIKLENSQGMKQKMLADISIFLNRYPDNDNVDELKQLEQSSQSNE